MKRALLLATAGLAFFAHTQDARAQACGGSFADAGQPNGDAGDDAGGDAGSDASPPGVVSCALNQYCATPDGGAILDGGTGVCAPEPCVVSSDCPNGAICDTSQNPFACVECISGADCPGDLVCDTANHTCVNPPPVPDASAPDAASDDAGVDAGPPDAGIDAALPPVDAGIDAGSPPVDASDASSEEPGPPQTDEGSLDGGAWDCALATARETPAPILAFPLAVVALLVARRRSREPRRRR